MGPREIVLDDGSPKRGRCGHCVMVSEQTGLPVKTYLNSNEDIFNSKIDACMVIKRDLGLLQPIFKRDFLLSNQITYMENIRYSEDFLLLLECSLRGANITIIPQALYNYQIDRGISLTSDPIELFSGCLEANRIGMERVARGQLEYSLLRVRERRFKRLLKFYVVLNPLKKRKLVLLLSVSVKDPSAIMMFVVESIIRLFRKTKRSLQGLLSV